MVAAIAASNGEEQIDDMPDDENAVSGDVVAELDAWGDAEEPKGADLVAAAFGESDPEEIAVSMSSVIHPISSKRSILKLPRRFLRRHRRLISLRSRFPPETTMICPRST